MSGVTVDVRDVVVSRGRPGDPPILDRVTLSLPAGARHALVGGSGSGKSTLLRVLLGRVPVASGTVRLGDVDIPPLGVDARGRLARTVAWIPQDAAGSLDPRMTARAAVAEGPRLHGLASGRDADAMAEAGLSRVGIPANAFERRPGEMSGGQAQRVAIARALATRPGLVLADEPTSALDPLVQARILALLFDQCDELGATVLIVAHSLGIVRRWCATVGVMHDGRIVESGAVADVLDRPAHEVTRALVEADAPVPGPA